MITENVSSCRFSPTDHGSICNSNILKYRVTTFWLDTLEDGNNNKMKKHIPNH